MAGPRKHPPIPVIVFVLTLLIGGGVWWWWSSSAAPTEAAGLSASGEVEAREYQVAAALAGRLTDVLVAEGDPVTKGQVVAKLDRTALTLQIQQAKQGVVAARATLKEAKDDGSQAEVTAARARLRQAEAAVDLARVQRDYATITAPRDGVVVSVTTNVGQNAAPGKTLLTIIDSADRFVRVFVPETRIGNVTVGQAVRMATDSSSEVFDGTVTYIAAEAEFTPNNVQTAEQRVKLVYEVRVSVADDSGTLKAGMPVDVTFV